MCDRLAHRGPDSHGLWSNAAAGVALGHRRLSILDMSAAGAQPMLSASERFAIVFNGEIYNFAELAAGLEAEGRAPVWRGRSDTEILLACIEAYGLDAALARLRGMFAFALFDARERRLHLARDAFGEKPLYLARVGAAFAFASELKALTCLPAFERRIDPQALVAVVRHGYLGAAGSLYVDAAPIAPGSCVTFSADGARASRQWWDHEKVAAQARSARFSGTPAQAAQTLDGLIHASVARQSVADVSVGAFLSGGIDSSVIAAIMQAQRATPIDTFTLGFEDAAFDESSFARAMARHIGSRHHEIRLSGEEARDMVARMPDIYDEPFVDPSQLPMTAIAAFARKSVVVCLSGDAGDELFAGYGRHHAAARRWSGGLSGLALRGASGAYARALLGIAALAKSLGAQRLAGRDLWSLRLRLEGLKARSGAGGALEAYERAFTTVDQAHLFVRGGAPLSDPLVARLGAHEDWSTLDQASMLDVYRYLPDDILVKVDRAAMAHSLETRVPLLDPDIARFAWSLPDSIKLMNGERKGVLKAVLARYAPRELWDRPKRGFGAPVGAWLRGPLLPLAEDLFSPQALSARGLLEPEPVARVWRDFLAGGQRRSNLVWSLFVLQLYLAREPAA
jgi:asparagine synthase (glutamine-hydrolysing)